MVAINVIEVKRSGHIGRVKQELAPAFEIVDMGPFSFYLGLKAERDREKNTLKLSQLIYIGRILAKYHFNQAKSCNTSIKQAILLLNKSSKPAKPTENNTKK